MSFDLFIVSPRPGESLERAVERVNACTDLEGEPELFDAASAARLHAMVATIVRAVPELVPFEFDIAAIAHATGQSEAEVRARLRHVELNESPEPVFGLQVQVHHDHAAISLAYRHEGTKAQEAFEIVNRICGALKQQWGMRTYDPQSGTEFNDERRADALPEYQDMSGNFGDIAEDWTRECREFGE